MSCPFLKGALQPSRGKTASKMTWQAVKSPRRDCCSDLGSILTMSSEMSGFTVICFLLYA